MMNVEELVDLASEKLGASVLWATDDFFADKDNLIKPHEAEWREHAYTDRGKWMDGWESRRKRAIGPDVFDEVIVRLGLPGIVHGVVVDTSFFRGNFPEGCLIETCHARIDATLHDLTSDLTEWSLVLPRSPLEGNAKNPFEIASRALATHLRLRIFPDGGVARLRVYGQIAPDWRRLGGARNEIDLAALECGGEVLSCSDMFFGPKNNLIAPGRAVNMSDGWETKRRRGVGPETHDWAIVKLAGEGSIDRVEIDTNHFKGNFPDTCSLEGSVTNDGPWTPFLARTKLMAHTRHVFVEELLSTGPFTHVRMNVFPDGGVSRLRVIGHLSETGKQDAVAAYLDGLSPRALQACLRACCASQAWIRAMEKARPFSRGITLFEKADSIWNALPHESWLEAFAAHPRIGEIKVATTRESRWSAGEQAQARRTSSQTLSLLSVANLQYEEKFGHVFLICATGKSGAEILHAARTRLQNTREMELPIAAEELRQIMHLRLKKLVGA